MTGDSNLNGSWKPAARSDADVDLLQRSINHVEYLLDRLELGAVPTSQGGVVPTSQGEGSDRSEMATAATRPDTIAEAPSGGSRTVAASLPLAAQTDALRITLEAHEEASRIRAQAAAMHAEVIAERERLFIAARQLFETLRVDAIYESPGAGMPRAVGHVQTEPTERDTRNRFDANVAEIALPADAVKLLMHDFPGLVAGLSDALACLQKLTTAIGAEIPPAAADAPATDQTAGHGRAPTGNRANGPSFRVARR